MLDLDKDWIPVILAIVGPSLLGVGWWFKTRREDKLQRELEMKTEKLGLLAKIEDQQKLIFAMQQERISDEANKRREADTSVSLMKDMTVLQKNMTVLVEKALALKVDQ